MEGKTKEINQRQIIVLIIMMVPGAKFLILPSVLAQSAGRDAWVAAALMFAIDFICLISLLLSFGLNKNGLSFFDVLNRTLSFVGTKIILFLYAVFFIFRIICTYLSVHALVQTTFGTFTNWIGFIVPVLLVLGYNAVKGVKNIARLTEILVYFFMAAALLIIVLSFDAEGLQSLSPVLADGPGPLGDAMRHGAFWFGDTVFLAFLLAKFRPRKGLLAGGSAGFWFAAACTVFFTAGFVSVYGNFAQIDVNALARISGFSTRLATESRFDRLLVVLWLSEVVIKTALMFYCAAASVRGIIGTTGKKGRLLVVLGICAVIAVLPLFINFKDIADRYVAGGFIRFLFYIPQYAVPLALPLMVWLANKKRKEKPAKVIDAQKNLAEVKN